MDWLEFICRADEIVEDSAAQNTSMIRNEALLDLDRCDQVVLIAFLLDMVHQLLQEVSRQKSNSIYA